MGKVEAGTLRIGAQCVVMPNLQRCEIKAIYYQNDFVEVGVAGEHLKIAFTSPLSARKGEVLCMSDSLLTNSPILEERLDFIDSTYYEQLRVASFACSLHLHTFSD